jgi:hypothetical protein
MIKARVRLANRETFVFGLTSENWTRLLDNKPIHVNGASLGAPSVQFVILGGETEDDIREDLRAMGIVPTIKPDPLVNP